MWVKWLISLDDLNACHWSLWLQLLWKIYHNITGLTIPMNHKFYRWQWEVKEEACLIVKLHVVVIIIIIIINPTLIVFIMIIFFIIIITVIIITMYLYFEVNVSRTHTHIWWVQHKIGIQNIEVYISLKFPSFLHEKRLKKHTQLLFSWQQYNYSIFLTTI